MVQLPPAALHQLNSPIEPHEEQEGMLEIVGEMKKLDVPGVESRQCFVHERLVLNTSVPENLSTRSILGPKDFSCATLQQVSARRALFLRTARPAQRGPGLKPSLHLHRPFFRRNRAFAKCRINRSAKGVAALQRAENGIFLLVEPAEIYGVVDTMNGQENLRRLQFGEDRKS